MAQFHQSTAFEQNIAEDSVHLEYDEALVRNLFLTFEKTYWSNLQESKCPRIRGIPLGNVDPSSMLCTVLF